MNKTEVFKCEFCGKIFTNEIDCMNHEQEHVKKDKLAREKEIRKAEVREKFKMADEMYNEAVELERQYQKDYRLSALGSLFYWA